MRLSKYITPILQPLALGSFRNWCALLREGGGVEARYVPKAVYVSVMSALGAPVRVVERAKYGPAIADTEITEPPVFIVGHWRTGTTLLHNLLSLDENMGYVSTLQTTAPELFIIGGGFLRFVLPKLLPEKRPQDNVVLSLDLPQEEELALVNVCPYAFYCGWYFPKKMRDYFRRVVLFNGVSEEVRANWKEAYMGVLKKATYVMGGKRLVLKNPANTARVKTLLELFPDAKFVHLCRNPYVLYPSTQRLYRKFLKIGQYQRISDEELDENILLFFRELMQRYFAERALIPANNLVEVRFEEFEEHPLEGLERIYRHLGLPGFEEAVPRFRNYVADQAAYKKNVYKLDTGTIDRISKQWGFAIEEWGYSLPEEMRAC